MNGTTSAPATLTRLTPTEARTEAQTPSEASIRAPTGILTQASAPPQILNHPQIQTATPPVPTISLGPTDSEQKMDSRVQKVHQLSQQIDEVEMVLEDKMTECIEVYTRLQRMLRQTNQTYYDLMKKLRDD